MEMIQEFAKYLEHVSQGIGRSERKASLRDYCQGLMLPLKRKSMEPLAAALDATHVRARHQALQQFVADSPWSDEAVLGKVQSWVLPRMVCGHKGWVFLIADDTGMPKAGTHSVGVARQYCGQLPGRRQQDYGRTSTPAPAGSRYRRTPHAARGHRRNRAARRVGRTNQPRVWRLSARLPRPGRLARRAARGAGGDGEHRHLLEERARAFGERGHCRVDRQRALPFCMYPGARPT